MVFVNEADQGGKRLKIGKKNNKKIRVLDGKPCPS